jgi:hypothetical protein
MILILLISITASTQLVSIKPFTQYEVEIHLLLRIMAIDCLLSLRY